MTVAGGSSNTKYSEIWQRLPPLDNSTSSLSFHTILSLSPQPILWKLSEFPSLLYEYIADLFFFLLFFPPLFFKSMMYQNDKHGSENLCKLLLTAPHTIILKLISQLPASPLDGWLWLPSWPQTGFSPQLQSSSQRLERDSFGTEWRYLKLFTIVLFFPLQSQSTSFWVTPACFTYAECST